MKSWKIWIPVGIAAIGAAAAAVLLSQKPEGEANAPKAAAKAAPAPAGKLQEGSYSFISGFRDPVKVELTLAYDPERYSFSVVSEDFLCYSSDSHVALLFCDDYSMQIEYAAFYQGEDFEALAKTAAGKFKGFAQAAYGENQGFRYMDGDGHCFCFPIPGDANSYILVNVIRAGADPEEFAALPEEPAFAALLGSMRFELRR